MPFVSNKHLLISFTEEKNSLKIAFHENVIIHCSLRSFWNMELLRAGTSRYNCLLSLIPNTSYFVYLTGSLLSVGADNIYI